MNTPTRSSSPKSPAGVAFATAVADAAPDSLLAAFSDQFFETHDQVLRRYAHRLRGCPPTRSTTWFSRLGLTSAITLTGSPSARPSPGYGRGSRPSSTAKWSIISLEAKLGEGVEPEAALIEETPETDAAWRQQIVQTLLEQLQRNESTIAFTAFHQRQMEDRPIADVARALGITPQQVSTYHHRLLNRLRHRAAVHVGLPLGQVPDWL